MGLEFKTDTSGNPIPRVPEGSSDTKGLLHNSKNEIEVSSEGGALKLITPESFGAVGDGTTDDTIAFQDAINHSAVTKGVVIASKNYLVTKIILPTDSSLSGNGKIIAYSNLANGGILRSNGQNTNNVSITDITIDGNRLSQTNNVSGISIGDGSYDFVIDNVTITECSGSGIALGAHDIIIKNCDISNTNFNSINAPSTVTYPIYNIDVLNNKFKLDLSGISAGCIEFDDGAKDLRIIGNDCIGTEFNEHLIQVEQLSGGCVIRDNTTDGGSYGIYFGDQSTDGESRSIISGNSCRNAKIVGIFIQNANGLILDSNIAYFNGNDGIRVSTSSTCVLSNNISYNNGKLNVSRYGILSSANTNCTLTGNVAYDDQSSKTQSFGIYSTSGSDNTCIGNNSSGNITGQANFQETGNTSFGNEGYTRVFLPTSSSWYSEINMEERIRFSEKTLSNVSSPSLAGGNIFFTGGTNAIFGFSNSLAGQQFTIIANHNLTIVNGASLILSGGVNFDMVIGNAITLFKANNNIYYEISRNA